MKGKKFIVKRGGESKEKKIRRKGRILNGEVETPVDLKEQIQKRKKKWRQMGRDGGNKGSRSKSSGYGANRSQ